MDITRLLRSSMVIANWNAFSSAEASKRKAFIACLLRLAAITDMDWRSRFCTASLTVCMTLSNTGCRLSLRMLLRFVRSTRAFAALRRAAAPSSVWRYSPNKAGFKPSSEPFAAA